MSSNHSEGAGPRKGSLEPKEVRCHRCYGTGEDDDGADCLTCLGLGTLIV